MDKRTKILLFLFGVAGAYVVIAKGIYPSLVEPLLTMDDRILTEEKRLAELQAKQDTVERRKLEYEAYAARVGSMNWNTVKAQLQVSLNDLIARHGIKESRLESPRAPKVDRKTELQELSFTVSGESSVESAVGFLKDIAELPDLVRVEEVRFTPVAGSGKNKKDDTVDFRASLKAMVLPQQRVLGKKLEDEKLDGPEKHARHRGADYASIWQAKPFWPYEEPERVVVATPKPARETKKPPVKKEPDPIPVKPDPRWPDRAKLELVWTGMTGSGDSVHGECMISESGGRGSGDRFVTVGGEFDGGKLLFVHQTGVLVEREGDYFVYPLGQKLNEDIPVPSLSDEFASLKKAYELIKTRDEAPVAQADAEAPGRDILGSPEVVDEPSAGDVLASAPTMPGRESGRRDRPGSPVDAADGASSPDGLEGPPSAGEVAHAPSNKGVDLSDLLAAVESGSLQAEIAGEQWSEVPIMSAVELGPQSADAWEMRSPGNDEEPGVRDATGTPPRGNKSRIDRTTPAGATPGAVPNRARGVERDRAVPRDREGRDDDAPQRPKSSPRPTPRSSPEGNPRG